MMIIGLRHAVLAAVLASALPCCSLSAYASASTDSPSASSAPVAEETGLAAVYSDSLNGHRTASGTIYNRDRLTAAHKTLAFGTEITVINIKNGKTVKVKITDRGPKQSDRILDLSPRAARALGIGKHSMTTVKINGVST